jgi:GMP synthase-like glutamine amidotransferase
MILMIDNYDSFTYNLVQYIGQLGGEVVVHRNDKISLDEIRELKPDAIVISPGPCTPKEAGISVEVIRQFGSSIPILGVCLGHQIPFPRAWRSARRRRRERSWASGTRSIRWKASSFTLSRSSRQTARGY